METTASNKKKKALSKQQWVEAYIEHVLTTGQNPPSVFAFAKQLKSNEAAFYTHFNSFTILEQSIWSDWFKETISVIEKDSAYADYSVREKLLAFYFTWLESLKANRSYVLKQFEALHNTEINPSFLGSLKQEFKRFADELIIEGKDTSEVAERPFSKQYEKGFWLHFMFVMRFWVKDDSKDFEKTDAAIEKSVHLAFDLVAKGPLDSMIDFAKFLFQNRA